MAKIVLHYQVNPESRTVERVAQFSTKCKFIEKDARVYIYSEDGKLCHGATKETLKEIERKCRWAEQEELKEEIISILSSKMDKILENQEKILQALENK